MTYRTRKRLFITFAIIFFISVPLVVLYTKGYRTDWENKNLVKTGGIDLRIKTDSTKVFLNDKLKKETGFLFRGVVFRNLIPGKYNVRVEKENYHSWTKNILVEEEQVTAYHELILFPEKLQKNTVIQNILYADISPNKKYAIAHLQLAEEKNGILKNQIAVINLENNSVNIMLSLNVTDKIQNSHWNSNSNLFSITIQKNTGIFIYTGSVNNKELKDWSTFLLKNLPIAFNKTSQVIPIESVNDLVIVDKSLKIHYLNIEKKIVNIDALKNILAFDIIKNEIFYFNQGGLLQKINITNISKGKPIELSPTTISKPKAIGAKMIVRNDRKALLIINNGDLFLWQNKKPLERIAVGIANAKWSQDKNKILYWNKNNIYVYWIKEEFGPPQRLPADREEIQEFNNIQNVYWLSGGGSHVIIKTAQSLILSEVDSRDKRIFAEYDFRNSGTLLDISFKTGKIYTIENRDLIEWGYK